MSDETCPAMLFMYDGEYEGDCELPAGHDGAHWDGLSTWRSDEDGYADHDTVDLEEDQHLDVSSAFDRPA